MIGAAQETSAFDGLDVTAGARRWSLRAFGVTFAGDFASETFGGSVAPGSHIGVPIELCAVADVEDRWQGLERERRGTVAIPNGPEVVTVDFHPHLGFRVWCRDIGIYLIAPDGSAVTCGPIESTSWHWRRFLIGQVLPLVAAIRGMELFHASAVAMGSRAVAFFGDSGAGKTSLAAQSAIRGAAFLADDVLAIQRIDDILEVHPGTPFAGIRHAELAHMSRDEQARLGARMTENEKEVVFRLRRVSQACPLAALFMIDRHPSIRSLSFSRVDDPRLLLASTFNFVHRPPERLMGLLDTCSVIDATAPILRVSVPPSMSAAQLAEAVHGHVEGAIA